MLVDALSNGGVERKPQEAVERLGLVHAGVKMHRYCDDGAALDKYCFHHSNS